MNIAIVVIDTFRYDCIGANGNDWIQTPNLDRLVGESLVFRNSFAASYPTVPHRTDVLTGRYGGPFHSWQPLRYDVRTFPEILADAGYCTQLIFDTPHLINGGHNFDWPFHAWQFIRGAEVDRPTVADHWTGPDNWAFNPMFDFIEGDEWKGRGVLSYGWANQNRKKDEDWNCAKLFLAASQFLRDNARRENFLLWVDCFDPHEPWDAPPEFVRMYDKTPGYDGRIDPRGFVWTQHDVSEEVKKRYRAMYAAKVTWMDRWLGEFLDTLDQTGLSKNTALIVTADHGTKLGEYGQFHKGGPVIYEAEAHVPMMIRLPDGRSGSSDAIVQPQDIFPTALALAGVDLPADVDGYDMLRLAGEGGGRRRLALTGMPPSADRWSAEKLLFCAFDGEWCLRFAPDPACCELIRMGQLENVAAENAELVERLWKQTHEELARRGTDKRILRWLSKRGKGRFPAKARLSDSGSPPQGYRQYWTRLYEER